VNAGDEVDFAWITRENIGLLEGVGDDVFDEPIDPARLRRWADAPDHLMLLALAEDRIVGMCTAMIHHHADKATNSMSMKSVSLTITAAAASPGG